jgi:hypothetical protein
MEEHIDATAPKKDAVQDSQTPIEPLSKVPPSLSGPPSEQNKKFDKVSEIKASDWIMVIATIFIAIGTLVSAGAICFQWYEMHTGSVDTKAIADAAEKQADAAKDFAQNAERINEGIGNAVLKLDAQAQAIQRSADAAKTAAAIAQETLHVSERAYLTLGTPMHDFSHKIINIPIINSGRIPSGKMTAIIHEVTFKIADPDLTSYPLTDETILERHWVDQFFSDIPVGAPYTIEVFMPALDQAEFTSGKQGVYIVIELTYNDGFIGSVPQKWLFCDGSGYLSSAKTNNMHPCGQPEIYLQILKTVDGYPNQKFYHKEN